MKKNLLYSAMTLLLFSLTSSSFAQSTEEEAIKKVLTAETDAFYRRDLAAWKSHWSTDAKVSRMIISPTGANQTQGPEKNAAAMVSFIQSNPEPTNIRPKADNYTFRIDGNLAYVEYDQFTPAPTGEISHSHEYRVMSKENGEWKIANQIVTFPDTNNRSDATATEDEINSAGYKLLSLKRVNDAIDLFKMNVKLFPASWNVYDSLGEAYALAGNKQEAIKNYETSIQLNPKNDNGVKALEKLRAK